MNYKCDQCGRELKMGMTFHLIDGIPLCGLCYKLFQAKLEINPKEKKKKSRINMTECAICKLYNELLEHIEKRFRESKGYIKRAFEHGDIEPELQDHYKGMLSMENELLYDYFTNPEELPKFWKRPIKVIEIRKKLGLE